MTVAAGSFDASVIGAGPAGSSAADLLARSGLRTLLVDDSGGRRCNLGESLPPAARPLLHGLGVWDRLRADGHQLCRGNESAWGESRTRTTHFIRDPNGHGWHLDRPRFDTLLRDAARTAGASLAARRVTRIARADAQWTIGLDASGESSVVCSRWMIDCTGRRAWAARTAGARRIAFDRLLAFVVRARPRTNTAKEADSLTLVESSPDGWWYTSRLPDGHRLVVYLTDARDASARHARTREGFTAMLGETRHIRSRMALSDYVIHAPPAIVAADSSRLDRVTGEGWLAAGDAAASFDPLSSQGILAAVDSGQHAARALVAHLSGDDRALARYGTRLDAIYRAYLSRREAYYGQERRWRARDFWRRRLPA